MAKFKVGNLPDGSERIVELPETATEEEIEAAAMQMVAASKAPQVPEFQQRIDKQPSFMRAALGASEAGLQAATGLPATVLGGLAGLGDTALSSFGAGSGSPGDTVRKVQGAMTYQPRTTQGQKVSEALAFPMEMYGKGVHKVGDVIRGDDAGGARDFLGTTFDVAGESLPALVGGKMMLNQAKSATRAPLTRQQQTLAAAQQEGYVVPPSQVGRPSWLEGAGGKIRTAQTASAKNAEVTNRLAVKELGLPEGTTITNDLLNRMRKDAYKNGYEPLKAHKAPVRADMQFLQDVLDLSKGADRLKIDFPNLTVAGAKKISDLADGVLVQQMTAEGAVGVIKTLRSEANRNLSWKAQPNADAVAYGQAQKAAAAAIEGLVERNLAQSGQTSLLEAFRAARVKIAKSHTVENALNDATGNVSARALAAGKDADALTGGLKTAADFARGFTKSNQMPEMFGGTPPISPLDVSMGAAMAVGGQLAAGNVAGAAAGGIPLLRPFAAPMALRPGIQRGLLSNPKHYNFGALPYAMPLLNPDMRPDLER